MLKYTVENFYGSQEKHDLQLVKLNLNTDNLDEKEALENGWLIFKNIWYQCRSVRINIDKFEYKNKQNLEYEITTNHIKDVEKIYKQFVEYKGFKEEFNIFTDEERCSWLILKDENQPVAFTKFINYTGGIESQYTAWNYHKPRMSVGKLIVKYEIEHAKDLGFEYLYIGQGYEKGSTYKADFAGFEWWTGKEWSSDKEEYKRLCHQDSTINTLDDLSRVYNA